MRARRAAIWHVSWDASNPELNVHWMLDNMQVHLTLEYTLHNALAIVHGRLSVTQALECLSEERWESSNGQIV